MEKLGIVFDIVGVKYKLEETIWLDGRPLRWDATCSTANSEEFFVESDGPQHFSEEFMNRVSRRQLSKERVRAKFQDQRARDLLKEKHINDTGGLLFRFSYRQTAEIESLVAKMLEHAVKGTTGVVYMDSIYWND